MLLEILLLPIETTDMLLKEAPAWSTITSNKSFDITFLFTLPSLINTVLLVVAVSFLYSSPPAIVVAVESIGSATFFKDGLMPAYNRKMGAILVCSVDRTNRYVKIATIDKKSQEAIDTSISFFITGGNEYTVEPFIGFCTCIRHGLTGSLKFNKKNILKTIDMGYTEDESCISIYAKVSLYNWPINIQPFQIGKYVSVHKDLTVKERPAGWIDFSVIA